MEALSYLVWLKAIGCLIWPCAGRAMTWLGASPGVKSIDLHDRLVYCRPIIYAMLYQKVGAAICP